MTKKFCCRFQKECLERRHGFKGPIRPLKKSPTISQSIKKILCSKKYTDGWEFRISACKITLRNIFLAEYVWKTSFGHFTLFYSTVTTIEWINKSCSFFQTSKLLTLPKYILFLLHWKGNDKKIHYTQASNTSTNNDRKYELASKCFQTEITIERVGSTLGTFKHIIIIFINIACQSNTFGSTIWNFYHNFSPC